MPCAGTLVAWVARPGAAARLTQFVGRVRPLALELARALDSSDTSTIIGAVLGSVKADPRLSQARNCLAFDLLVSALLVEALRGDPTTEVVVDHFRRRRGLSPVKWRAAGHHKNGAGEGSPPVGDMRADNEAGSPSAPTELSV